MRLRHASPRPVAGELLKPSLYRKVGGWSRDSPDSTRSLQAVWGDRAEIVAKNVRLYRELADLAGVTPSTVWSIEAGRHAPHPKTIHQLAAALKIEPGELLKPRLL